MELKTQIEAAMRQAGDRLLEKNDFAVHNKHGDYDFVTDMDVKTQETLKASLAQILPEAVFVGEEDPDVPVGENQYFWMVDPIDGTTNFIRDMRLSCLAVALCRGKEELIGAVYHPWAHEFFYAEKGKGAFVNDTPIHVADKDFHDAVMCYGQGYGKREDTLPIMRPMLEKCYMECCGVRALGVAEITLCYIAAGRMDLYFEQKVMPWDYAAGGLILREAGGVCTNWHGEHPALHEGDSLLAGTIGAHAGILPLAKTLL